MNWKIKCYLHNSIQATLDDDFPKVISYFKAHGVNIIFDFEHTDVEKQSAVTWLMQPLSGQYDVVMYLYNRGTFQAVSNGLTFRVSPNLIGIYMATALTDDAVNYEWKSMVHEICHSLFTKFTNGFGNVPLDTMLVNGVWTPYYKNEEINPDGTGALDGNFAQVWKILNPYINAPQPLIATLTRDSGGLVETTGKLVINDFKCLTLERPWLNNQTNISCIPKGIYQCVWSFSLRLLRYTYEIKNVAGRSGIRIHAGNFFFDTDGCVLLGDSYGDVNGDGRVDILNSRKTIQAFETLMNKQSFTLVIK